MAMSLADHLATEVQLFATQAVAAAEAEAAHKAARARRVLKAMHDEGVKSVAMAENIAEADDCVADLYSKRLITAALAEATKQKIYSLREAIGLERSRMASEREMDRIHSRDGGMP
jgi:hypothetical protein